MLSSFFRSMRPLAAGLSLLATTSLAAGAATRAETQPADVFQEDIEPTLSGSYLSALSATNAQDYSAAVLFLDDALQLDPGNPFLIDRAFALLMALGRIDDALPVAQRLLEVNPDNHVAQMALGAAAMKQKKFTDASKLFATNDNGPLANITSALLSAWAAQGQGQTDAALTIVKTLTGPSWYGVFRSFNSALIDDVAGRQADAVAAISEALKNDTTSMRVTEAYARILARAGRADDAKKALETYVKAGSRHPVILKLLDDLKAGRKPQPMVASAQQGAAEVFYGLGSALGSEQGGADLASVYLRLALYLNPRSDLVAISLGDLMQNSQRYDESVAVFESVPKTSILRPNAELQVALSLEAKDQHDEAIRRLKRLTAGNSQDFDALTALGTIERNNKQFAEAATTYGKAIAVLPKDDPRGWLIYYFRGIAYERSNQWPLAEADFLKALQINPKEPQVLNYLGYSWIDRGLNLDRATDMIKQAVNLRPNDGYIVDSLGWAYFRTGRYPEAVGQLERAVALKPQDSTINDHLGDAYWKVGRKLEATFQWSHARDFGPEPADKPRILDKIAHGLDVADSKASMDADKAAANVAVEPASITVAAGDSLWKIAQRTYGNGELYNQIIAANHGKLADPDIIVPGLVIDLPKLPTP